MSESFVTYLRVSTARQGQSGLGLDAQQDSVRRYADQTGGHIVDEFVEVESGRVCDRPALMAAIERCRSTRSTLLIAKLDRLSRNVAFVANLMEAGVEFVAADVPSANKLMLHILSAFAEHEREQISQRTKAALEAAKARGVVLGANGKLLAHRHRHEAILFADAIAHHFSAAIETGADSASAIARSLNASGVAARNGGRWTAGQVCRVRARTSAKTSI